MCFFLQVYLQDKDAELIEEFTEELIAVHQMFNEQRHDVPLHKNMPLDVCKLMWVYALKHRVQVQYSG